jgi:hypothetical protein
VPRDVGDRYELHDLAAARDDEVRRAVDTRVLQRTDRADEVPLGVVDDDVVDRARSAVRIGLVRRVLDQDAQRPAPRRRRADRGGEQSCAKRKLTPARPHSRFHK